MHARTSQARLFAPDTDLVAWRRRQLVRAGFDEESARSLASSSVDLHATIQLVESGCRPDLAARIMAPLDFEPDPR